VRVWAYRFFGFLVLLAAVAVVSVPNPVTDGQPPIFAYVVAALLFVGFIFLFAAADVLRLLSKIDRKLATQSRLLTDQVATPSPESAPSSEVHAPRQAEPSDNAVTADHGPRSRVPMRPASFSQPPDAATFDEPVYVAPSVLNDEIATPAEATPKAEAADWFYFDDQERVGPLSIQTLTMLVEQGVLNDEALVWNASFGRQWKPLRETQLARQTANFRQPDPVTEPNIVREVQPASEQQIAEPVRPSRSERSIEILSPSPVSSANPAPEANRTEEGFLVSPPPRKISAPGTYTSRKPLFWAVAVTVVVAAVVGAFILSPSASSALSRLLPLLQGGGG
jgi:hypothetical protein